MEDKPMNDICKEFEKEKIISEVYTQYRFHLNYQCQYIMTGKDKISGEIIKNIFNGLKEIYMIEATKILLDKELEDYEKLNKLYFLQIVMNEFIASDVIVPTIIIHEQLEQAKILSIKWLYSYSTNLRYVLDNYDKTRWIQSKSIKKYKMKLLKSFLYLYDVTGDKNIIDYKGKPECIFNRYLNTAKEYYESKIEDN